VLKNWKGELLMVGLAGFELLNVTGGLVSLGLLRGPVIELAIACVKRIGRENY
jgi:hypothetical protein